MTTPTRPATARAGATAADIAAYREASARYVAAEAATKAARATEAAAYAAYLATTRAVYYTG